MSILQLAARWTPQEWHVPSSLARYSRRLKELGLLPYLLIFIALVAALHKMGVIKGWDLIKVLTFANT